jgi:hypothetical protein
MDKPHILAYCKGIQERINKGQNWLIQFQQLTTLPGRFFILFLSVVASWQNKTGSSVLTSTELNLLVKFT